jgi:hypothetical protein
MTSTKTLNGRLILFCADILTNQIHQKYIICLVLFKKHKRKWRNTEPIFSPSLWQATKSRHKLMIPCRPLYQAMYRQFENSFRGIKNFAVAWIVGTAYQYLCNVIDPAGRDQHEL